MPTKQEVQNLYDKIAWEGGITEYVIHYGGELPEEFQDLGEDLENAYCNLKTALQHLYKKHGVGGY